MRRLAIAATCLFAGLAPTANATLVFNRGATSPDPSVWAANDDGSNAKKVAPDGYGPRIAPDGETVAYEAVDLDLGTTPKLMVVPAAGGKRSILLDPQWDQDTFAWSPDSKTIAAVTGRETGKKNLMLIDVESGATRTIATGEFYGVSFSPTGSALVYARASRDRFPPRSSLWVTTATGSSSPVQITSGHADISPLWGPDMIVFSRMRKPPKRYDAPKQDLWVMAPDGTPARRLTFEHPAFLLDGLTPVAWSDNGAHLLGQFGGQDTAFAQTVDPSTGKVHTVGRASEGIVGSALSHDGGTILATRGVGGDPNNNSDVVAIPYDGGRAQVLARHAFSPDWNR